MFTGQDTTRGSEFDKNIDALLARVRGRHRVCDGVCVWGEYEFHKNIDALLVRVLDGHSLCQCILCMFVCTCVHLSVCYSLLFFYLPFLALCDVQSENSCTPRICPRLMIYWANCRQEHTFSSRF